MTLPVKFLPEARQEALDTRAWYEDRQSGLGALFSKSLAAAVERLQAAPLSYPLVIGAVRRVVLQRFPYAVYFRLEVDEIIVLAVHGRQDPNRWQKRS
jgi:toxin ParE1/3/4